MSGNKSNSSKYSALFVLCLFILALLIRIFLIPFTNYDTDGYSRWYDFIVKNGIPGAMGQNFSIYTPPYLYLLSAATLVRNFIPKLVAIKLIPIFFDLINAFIIFKILRLKYVTGKFPYLAATIFLLAPTIFINSAFWGQIDSIYTFFLILSVYFMLTDRPLLVIVAFGLATSVKAQAAFLGPLLLIWGLKKHIAWYKFGLIPLTYFVVMLPAILAGRTVLDVSTVYLNQASELQILSFNAPNLYIFFPQSSYSVVMPIGMIITVLAIGVWIFINWQKKYLLTYELILFLSLVSTAISPFLLPKMHDRYFYPADVFSLILAFYNPKFWFIPIAYQIVSGLVYSIFLFGASRSIVLMLATEINTMIIIYLIWKHKKELKTVDLDSP